MKIINSFQNNLSIFVSYLRKPYLSYFILGILFFVFILSAFFTSKRAIEIKHTQNTFQNSSYLLGDSIKNRLGKFERITNNSLEWRAIKTFQTNEEMEAILNSEYLWIRVDLRGVADWENSFVLLEHEGVSFEVYNDQEKLLLKVGDFFPTKLQNELLESEFSWLNIGEESSSFLFIRVFHPKGQFYKIDPVQDLVGSQFFILDQFARANLVLLSIYFFFMIIGLIALLLSLIYWKQKYFVLLDFGLFVFLYGLLGLSTNPFIKFLMTEYKYFFILALLATNFVFIPMFSGLSRIFDSPERKVLDILIILNIALAAFNIVGRFITPMYPEIYNFIIQSRYITLILQKLNILIPAVLSYIVWRKGNNFGFGLFFSFTITLLCMIVEIYFSVIRRPDFLPLTHWGVLVGVLTQGIALERTFSSSRQKLFLLEKNLQEMKLKNLQEKMSPHFLFNSLNSIHALEQINPELVSEAILRLANNYRFFLDKSDRDWINFMEEWNFLEDYLHLQKLRFFDSLQIKMEVKGDFTSVNIPPLLIQPIVENSFKHGFRMLGNRTNELSIFAKVLDSKRVEVTIADNGSGFPIEILSNEENLFSRSLGNIKTRLELKLPGSRIKIDSSSEGTIVTITLIML